MSDHDAVEQVITMAWRAQSIARLFPAIGIDAQHGFECLGHGSPPWLDSPIVGT